MHSVILFRRYGVPLTDTIELAIFHLSGPSLKPISAPRDGAQNFEKSLYRANTIMLSTKANPT